MKKTYVSKMLRIFCVMFLCAIFLFGCGDTVEEKPAAVKDPAVEAGLNAVGDANDLKDQVQSQEEVDPEAEVKTEKITENKKKTIVKDDGKEDDADREPIEGQEIMDEALKLSVYDLDGNEIPTMDLIKGNKVVMINEWATFCGPCIREMPYLAELEREYKDQGFEIIGMTSDITDEKGNIREDLVNEARSIVDDTGVTYPVVIMPREQVYYLSTGVVPTTFFVDGEGRMLKEVMISIRSKEEWEEIIKELLENE